MPIFQKMFSWELVVTLLAIGPILGIVAILPYKRFESTNKKVVSNRE